MALILNNRSVFCSSPVLDWTAHGMRFKPWVGCRPRRTPIDLIVLHWTGGEASAPSFFRNIRARGLGIEFYIDRKGVIHQFCDPAFIDAFHSGRFNPRSIGIEIANYGFQWKGWKNFHRLLAPKRARDRDVYQTVINKRKVFVADFYQAQKKACFDLVISLCRAFQIPAIVPMTGAAKLETNTLHICDADRFQGIAGHFHLTKKKVDPGTRILEELNEYIETLYEETPPLR